MVVGIVFDEALYSDKDDTINTSCPFLYCLSCDALIMHSDGRGNLTSHDVKSHLPLLAEAHVIQPINSSSDGLVYYIRLSSEEQGTVDCIVLMLLELL